MPKIFSQLKNTIDATIPDKDELTHGLHPKVDYALLLLRNLFVCAAVITFIVSLFFHGSHYVFKCIGYFCGAVAYLFECLAVTDCFRKKIPHTEMFMVYCFGPLYILMGISYMFFA